MEESLIIKKLDADLKKFAETSGPVDEIFTDSKRYRRLADQFWNTKVVKRQKAA